MLNPLHAPIRNQEEVRQIEEEIRLASERRHFELVARLAARPLDLLRALRELRPSVVHFTGHAGADGIHLTGESGQPMQVTSDALHLTFGAAGTSVQIVVLSCCATEDLAEALCGLASSESVRRACLQGGAAMHLQAPGHHAPPLLHRRAGTISSRSRSRQRRRPHTEAIPDTSRSLERQSGHPPTRHRF